MSVFSLFISCISDNFRYHIIKYIYIIYVINIQNGVLYSLTSRRTLFHHHHLSLSLSLCPICELAGFWDQQIKMGHKKALTGFSTFIVILMVASIPFVQPSRKSSSPLPSLFFLTFFELLI